MDSGATSGARVQDGQASGPLRRLLRSMMSRPFAVVGVVTLAAFLSMALFAALVSPHDPALPHLSDRMLPPMWVAGGSQTYPLGTDQLGRDILSRLIFGSQVALIVGIGGVTLATIAGVVLGLTAGYFGGWYESTIMRIADVLISIPNLILYLAILGVFGPSITLLILVIGLVNWTTFARVIRAEVLAAKHLEYVEASRALGQSVMLILLRHLLPNTIAPIVVLATLNVAAIIILEASLSFLGFGVQPPTVTWGRMLADGREYISVAWWLATMPGLFITALGLALIFIGDWLRDHLDPRAH